MQKMRSNYYGEDDEMIYKCEICEEILYDKYTPKASEWDWFTGYLEKTVYFCHEHKTSTLKHKLFSLSKQCPEIVLASPKDCANLHSVDINKQ